jgi:hypothetical protein
VHENERRRKREREAGEGSVGAVCEYGAHAELKKQKRDRLTIGETHLVEMGLGLGVAAQEAVLA